MADFDTAEFRAARFNRSAADEIANRDFPVVMRGYDRAAVDAFVQEVAKLVGDLESRQSQETVVQKAIEEVGEETASILQRAHETADEIAARSRAQAEGRIQRAEREAELVRRQTDAYSEKILVETVCDLFLDHSQKHHSPDCYANYKHFLQSFSDSYGR